MTNLRKAVALSRVSSVRDVAFVIEQNNATGRVSYWQSGDHHSDADRDGTSLAEYIHAMYGLIRQAGARRVLMIGCGGGTLATMLVRVGTAVTIVDIDPASFEIARQYFHMPDGPECHVADGRAFLARDKRRHDAIVLDAYAGKSVPRHLVTESFFALAKTRLRPGGIFLANLIVSDGDEEPMERMARRMAKAWRDVRILDTPGWDDRNTVVVAGAVRGLERPRLLMKPRRCARRIAAYLRDMEFRDIDA